MRIFRTILFISCCLTFSVPAENEIRLSGTVKSSDGTAIDSAYVRLLGDSTVMDTTEADGKFLLTNIVGVTMGGIQSTPARSVRNIHISGGNICFSASSSGKGIVSIYSGNGKLFSQSLLSAVETGEYHVVFPGLSAGFYMLQIAFDEVTVTRKLVNTGSAVFLSGADFAYSSTSDAFRRGVASGADTLLVERNGYPSVKHPVSSYQEEGIEIVMNNSQASYAYGAEVENTCTDCPVPELPEASSLTKNSKFPDPFKKLDGNRITKKSEWRCRRAEILAQAMKYIYGDKPAPPEEVTGSVTNSKITVKVKDKGKEIEFSANISLPSSGEAPYPAIIAMGYGSEVTKKGSGMGVATITYNYSQLGKEQQPEGNVDRNKDFQGLFYDMYGGKHSAGLLMAWAWGASRLIDVLQEYGGEIIDYRRLGVTGCSRAGKAAFAVGLFDERMALTIPNETSCGGMVGYRITDANCSEKTSNNFPGQLWLSNNFSPFVNNTSLLPIDAHALIAAIAPRGFYGLENSSGSAAQMCPGAGNMAVQGAEEVYKALGCIQNLNYNSLNTETGHCGYSEKATPSLTACIDKFLLHKTVETGKIEAVKTYTRSDWIDWTAPPLEDDTDLYEEKL